MSDPTAAACSPSSGSLLFPTVQELGTKVSQCNNEVGNLQNSIEQLRSELFSVSTYFRFSKSLKARGSTAITPSLSSMPCGACWSGEGSSTGQNAVDACESASDGEMATSFRRPAAVEAMCEDLRDTLQDRLEPFRAELDDKLKHPTPSNFGTNEQNCDAAIPLGTTKQESTIVSGGDLSQTVASIYAIFRTEVMQEVGQLRSFVESEVQTLRSQFEVQSEKVEQNVVTVNKFETISNWLSQHMADISEDIAKLRQRDITSKSEVSELRSRLEVVVRECDERVSMEQSHLAKESAPFLSSLQQDNGLSERVHSLEKACQQAITMPCVVLEAAESLRAELRQVVDPLRDDVNCLKQAIASSQPNRDLAESQDPEGRSSPHEVSSLFRRISNLEAACAAESRKSWEVQQCLGAVEQGISQEVQKGWSTLNGEVASVTQTVELLRKENVDVQERMNQLADSVAHVCVSSLMKAEASLSKELIAMKNGNLATGAGAVVGGIVPFSRPPVEGQLKEAPQESWLEKAITKLDELSGEIRAKQAMTVTVADQRIAAGEDAISADLKSVRDMVAGILMSRLSALESMITRQLGSSTGTVVKSLAQRQASMTVQANSTLASEPRPAIDTSPNMNAAHTLSKLKSAHGTLAQPLPLQTMMPSVCASAPPNSISRLRSAPATPAAPPLQTVMSAASAFVHKDRLYGISEAGSADGCRIMKSAACADPARGDSLSRISEARSADVRMIGRRVQLPDGRGQSEQSSPRNAAVLVRSR